MAYAVWSTTNPSQKIIRLGNGQAVGSITRETQSDSAKHYHYIAVLHDSPTQDGRSASGYELAETVDRLLNGAPWSYVWPCDVA